MARCAVVCCVQLAVSRSESYSTSPAPNMVGAAADLIFTPALTFYISQVGE